MHLLYTATSVWITSCISMTCHILSEIQCHYILSHVIAPLLIAFKLVKVACLWSDWYTFKAENVKMH